MENVCKTVAAVWWKPCDKILASGSAVHRRTNELRPELLSYNCFMFFSAPGKVFAGAADTPMKQIQEVVVACQREFTLHDSFTWTPGRVLATDFLHQPTQLFEVGVRCSHLTQRCTLSAIDESAPSPWFSLCFSLSKGPPSAALLKTRELWLGFSQREGLVKPFRSDLNNREASQSAGQVYSSLTQQQGAALLIDAMTVLQRFGIHDVYWPKGKLYPLTEGFWS